MATAASGFRPNYVEIIDDAIKDPSIRLADFVGSIEAHFEDLTEMDLAMLGCLLFNEHCRRNKITSVGAAFAALRENDQSVIQDFLQEMDRAVGTGFDLDSRDVPFTAIAINFHELTYDDELKKQIRLIVNRRPNYPALLDAIPSSFIEGMEESCVVVDIENHVHPNIAKPLSLTEFFLQCSVLYSGITLSTNEWTCDKTSQDNENILQALRIDDEYNNGSNRILTKEEETFLDKVPETWLRTVKAGVFTPLAEWRRYKGDEVEETEYDGSL